ncbi:MAG: hypothetical protein ABFR53_00565 [Actinomycetota bacterium]
MADSQGVTLVTLAPTGLGRFKLYVLLRWALRYRSVTSTVRRFKGRSKVGAGPEITLEALNFIHFGRWILAQKHPVRAWRSPGLPRFDGQPAERPDHGFMVFTSNFDDEWPAYVDTFMEASLDDLGVFWDKTPGWTEPSKAGFEGFFEFVDDHAIDHTHYYAAFPRLATADIKAALAVDRHVRSFAIDTSGMSGAAWNRAFDLLVSKLQHSVGYIALAPSTYPLPLRFVAGGGDHFSVTSIAPFPVERVGDLAQKIQAYTNHHSSPFAAVAGTHFARLTLINDVHDGNKKRQLESGYVLMSADADSQPGQGAAWLGELFDVWSNIHPTGTPESLVDLVWGDCYGFAPNRSRQQFLDYIARTSFKPTVPFADYPGTSLWDIHRALHTHRWFTDFVFARAGGGGPGQADFDDLMSASLPVDPP